MYSKALALGLWWLISTAAAAKSTPPSTTCATVGTDHAHTRTYTRILSCTNTATKKRTTVTTTQPVTTSTVVSTSTITASTSTDTATETDVVTETDFTTTTETETQTQVVTETDTTTLTYSTNAPNKRALVTADQNEVGARNVAKPTTKTSTRSAPSPGVYCTVARCVNKKTTTSLTSTKTLSTSTATDTSTVSTTVTPNASTTTTVTSTSTSLSTITESTTTVTTSTTTTTTTVYPTAYFNILSKESPSIPDDTPIQAFYPLMFSSGDAAVFYIDPSTGYLHDAGNGYAADINFSVLSPVYLNAIQDSISHGWPICQCSIDPDTHVLSCNCGGDTIFQTPSTNQLYIGTSSAESNGYSPVTLVASIVDQM